MKTTSTMTSKGQVTVPIAIRRKLGLKSGDHVEFVQEKERTIIRRARSQENPFLKYVGALKGPLKSVKDINRWISEMRDED